MIGRNKMRNVDVVCVNWGDKYAPEYVARLKAMVARNTTKILIFIASQTIPTHIKANNSDTTSTRIRWLVE